MNMGLVTDLTIAAPGVEILLEVQRHREQAVQKPNHIKSLLWFETNKPRFLSSLMLSTPPYEINGPVLEWVAILTPVERTFDLDWAYLDDFERLKDEGIIQSDATLASVDIIEEDHRFLAWVM
jgi:hypothetical protein